MHTSRTAAAISSGSFQTDGMAVVPCSAGSLGAIAQGVAGHLVHRAADVVLKERRKLVMVVREAPLSEVHLENMLKLARLGAVILPPMPAFYNQPESVEDIVDHIVARVMDQFGLEADFVSFADAVRGWARREHVERVGLMAARPVASLSEWSPYRSLVDELEVEQPRDIDDLHELITAVKTNGGGDRALSDRFTTIVQGFESETLLLACTELPLIAQPVVGHRLVDVTDLVAEELIRRWWAITAD